MPKIEVVKQRDLKDCGPCCIETVLKYFGGYVPLEKIRDDTCTGVNGTTAYHIIKALCNYGFEAMGVKVESIFDENMKNGNFLEIAKALNLNDHEFAKLCEYIDDKKIIKGEKYES